MTVHSWVDDERLYAADLNSSFSSVLALNGCRVTRTAVQAITTATDTAIAFDAEVRDDGGYHSNVTNNSRLTVPVTGWYDFGFCVEFPANATGFRLAKVRRNAANYILAESEPSPTAGVACMITGASSMYLAATDYLELYVHQTSGGNLNVNLAADYTPIFWIAARRGT